MLNYIKVTFLLSLSLQIPISPSLSLPQFLKTHQQTKSPVNLNHPESAHFGNGFQTRKGWLAIAKIKPLSLFISLLLMLKKAFDNVKIEN